MRGLTAISTRLRSERGALHHRVASRRPRVASMAELAAVLDEKPAALDGLLLWDVLGWCHRMTDRMRGQLVRHAGVGEYRPVGLLTDRQREALCHVLRSPDLLTGSGSAEAR